MRNETNLIAAPMYLMCGVDMHGTREDAQGKTTRFGCDLPWKVWAAMRAGTSK